jgi:anaphase-promoting complex subunit 2
MKDSDGTDQVDDGTSRDDRIAGGGLLTSPRDEDEDDVDDADDAGGGGGGERFDDADGDLEFLSLDEFPFSGGSLDARGASRRAFHKHREWARWEPEPVESEAAASRGRTRRGDDALGQLVSIYGSKELFIGEYRNMLAERLLSKVGYDVDRETHALELLKLRFGESSLHKCEVMLKDVRDSKRLNGNVKALPAPGTPAAENEDAKKITKVVRNSPLDATVVSALFWPPLADEAPDFVLPRPLREMADAYAERYHHLKAPRKLKWRPALGTARVEVFWKNVEVAVSVGPIEAALVSCFAEKERWTTQELCSELGLTKPVVRRKAVVWINTGILVELENGGGYGLTDPEDEKKRVFGVAASDDAAGDAGSGIVSAEAQAAAGMKVYEQYVVGMLTNFPSLPLERIHNMLKMFVSEPPYDRTQSQLAAFLAQLVAEEKVVAEGNHYKRRAP